MAALPDWLKKNIPKPSVGGIIGAATFLPDVAGVATSEHKITAIGKALASIYFWVGKIFAPVRQALYGGWMILGFNVIGKAVQSLVKDTGSLEAALKRLQSVRGFERQFTSLLGGLGAAKQRVAELLVLSQRGPFKFEEIATASRNLEVFTHGALGGVNATRLIGNVAIASGNGIEQTADAVGRFYQTLRAGEPVQGATEELRQMGAISQQTANDLDAMAQHGATSTEMFNSLTEALGKTHSNLQQASEDLATVSAEHEKAVEEMKAKFGAPWTDAEVQSTKNMTIAFKAITPALAHVSGALAMVFTSTQTASSALARLFSQSLIVQNSIKLLGNAIAVLSTALLIVGTIALPAALGGMMKLGTTIGASTVPWIMKFGSAFGITMLTATKSAGLLINVLKGVSVAMVGLGVAFGVLSIAGVLINLVSWVKRTEDAVQRLKDSFNRSNAALREQIHLAKTLTDRHEVLAKAIEQVIDAHERLREAQGKPFAFRERAVAKEAEEKARKTLEKAEKLVPEGLSSPQREALVRQSEQRRLSRERQEFEVTQRQAGPEGRIAAARQFAGVLRQRAQRGITSTELHKELAEEESGADARKQAAKARKKFAQQEVKDAESEHGYGYFHYFAAKRRLKAARAEVTGLEKEPERIRLQAKYAETPEGLGARADQIRKELESSKNLTQEQRAQKREQILLLETQAERLKNEREQAVELENESKELEAQAALEEQALNIQRIRSTAELELARATGSPGERARKEFEIGSRARQAELTELQRQQKIQVDIANQKIEAEKARPGGGDKEVVAQLEASRDALSAQNEERTKAIQIQQEQARVGERERIRAQIVTRVQTGLETRGVQARLAGRGEEAKTAEHVSNFVSKFEQLRQQFGDQEAKRLALQQEGNEISKEAASYATSLKPIADSLTRVGGGGGVGGPTGDPQLIIAQRQVALQQAANQYLASIEQELRNQGAPEEGGGEAQPAQQGEQPIEGGRKAEVGESQEKVNEIERNRIAAEKIQQPAVAPPAPPAAGAPPPAIAPPAAPAAKPAAPAVAPPAAPVAAVTAPAIAPPAAPVPTGLNVPITQPATPAPPVPAAPAAPAAEVEAVTGPLGAKPAMPTIAQPGYHLPPSYAESIGKTIGTKEYPLPKLPPSVSIGAPGVTMEQPGPGVAKPIDASSPGGERYYSPGADAARTLRDIRRDNQESNTYLNNISTHSDKAGKTL